MPWPSEVESLLAECACLSLSFCDDDGPWAAALFFAAGPDGALYFTSSPDSRHGALEEGAAIAATINPDPSDWRDIRGLQCRGRIVRLADEESRLARETYLRKFADIARIVHDPATPDERKIASAFLAGGFYALQLSSVRLIDNRGGFALRRQFVNEGGSWVEK